MTEATLMCLLYSDGEGRSSLIRGGPIGSTHRRGEWLFVESAPIQAIPQTHQAIPTEVCYFLFSFILSSNNYNLSLSLIQANPQAQQEAQQAIPQAHQASPAEDTLVCCFLFSFLLSSNNSNLCLSLSDTGKPPGPAGSL
jgi:hypothetical protein